VGDLKKKRLASFAIVSVDDGEIAKSEKKSEPAPQWEWKDLEL
jgi:predicted Fe-Mo cluster-binding NifX family protein